MGTIATQAQIAAVRRGLMRVKPAYFSWPVEVQEQYRASMPEEDDFRIRQTILKSLFHLQVQTREAMEAALRHFDDARFLLLNSTLLPLMGIGEDCFWLNEYLGDKTILDFNTLFDYDHADHAFQEQARKGEFPGYVPKPYRGSLYYTWARLQIDGSFYYATLSMAAGYIFSRIEDAGSNLIDELIPHRYIDGKEHGKRQGKGRIFDKRIVADGMEGQLDELKDRFRGYLSERCDTLQDEFDHKAPRNVYLVDRSTKDEPQMDFVFTDRITLRNVRFRHYMRDCRAMLSGMDDLRLVIEREGQAAAQFLHESHQDILENFDPSVVKFRRRRKIVIADGALDDFL